MAGEATSVDADMPVEADMHVVRPEDTAVVPRWVVVGSTVARLAEDSTVAAVSTVEVADTVEVVTAKFARRLDLDLG